MPSISEGIRNAKVSFPIYLQRTPTALFYSAKHLWGIFPQVSVSDILGTTNFSTITVTQRVSLTCPANSYIFFPITNGNSYPNCAAN